jgi:hypothetical protein
MPWAYRNGRSKTISFILYDRCAMSLIFVSSWNLRHARTAALSFAIAGASPAPAVVPVAEAKESTTHALASTPVHPPAGRPLTPEVR